MLVSVYGAETTAKCIDCGASVTIWLYPGEGLQHRHASEYGRVLPTSARWEVVRIV